MYIISVYIIFIILAQMFNELNSNYTEDICPKVLPRKKRFLAFPEDSHFVVTVSLLKSTPFEATVNTLHEIDVALPLAKSVYPPQLFHSRKEKMIVYKQTEAIIDWLGYNGKQCLQRLVCEVMSLNEKFVNTSIVLRILVIIFRLPYENSSKEIADKFVRKIKQMKKQKCINNCKFSIFPEFILNFNK